MPKFKATDIPRLDGKTAIVTGASSGLGSETARVLAAAGAHVVYAVRDVRKGQAVASAAGGSFEVCELDLANLDSVRRFADAWQRDIHLLINNAGVVMPSTLARTTDGFELQFGVNHLGHFALTLLLLENIHGRIVAVSAAAERYGTIDFDDLNWHTRTYSASKAYSQSKLANLLFIAELQRRFTSTGSPLLAVAAHPGWSATGAITNSGGNSNLLMRIGNHVIAQTPAAGALEILYAAVAHISGNTFVGPGGFGGMRGAPKPVKPSDTSQDPQIAKRLWSASCELTQVQPTVTL